MYIGSENYDPYLHSTVGKITSFYDNAKDWANVTFDTGYKNSYRISGENLDLVLEED